jgi:hypothetical protein
MSTTVNSSDLVKNKKANVSSRYLRDKDREIVKGIFRFHEVPGGEMRFVYKFYKEDQVELYELKDGEVYSIPLGVARHLNKDCNYPVHSFMLDEYGKPIMRIGQKVQRCSFQSLEFIDLDDLKADTSSLVTAENVPATL